MTKIVTRAMIFLVIGGWLLYLVLYGNLLANVPNNGVYQIFIMGSLSCYGRIICSTTYKS